MPQPKQQSSSNDAAPLVLPHCYEPRVYQQPFWQAMSAGCKRALLVWHRRSGKDKTALNWTISQMWQRVGVYFYLFPTFAQAKRVIWDGRGKDGFKFLDHFPPELIAKVNETEMKIELTNGSIFQLVGADAGGIDRLVGTNPVGIVFSEYALIPEKAWDYVRPILLENGGWAVFIYTPRGKNHAFDLHQRVRGLREWFEQTQTVDDTGVVSPEDIQLELAAGMDPQLVQQEFYCSYEGGLVGSYYAAHINALEKEPGRIGTVRWEPQLPVITAWDLGVGDSTAIWFAQQHRREVRLIDFYENSGEGLPHYAKVLRDKPYVYARYHIGPHDLAVRELTSGRSRVEIARDLGLRFRVLPKYSIEDGVAAARRLLPLCWFDQDKTRAGLKALVHYHKELDEERRVFKNKPVHDWSSHPADAFRYLALGLRDDASSDEKPYGPAETQFNPYDYEQAGRARDRAVTEFDPYNA